MILRKLISPINVYSIPKSKGFKPLIKILKRNDCLNNLVFRKIIIITSFLICMNITAQEAKKDKYLNSLAKKIQFKYKELYFREGSLDAIKEIANYIKKNGNYYSVESNTSSEGRIKGNQILTDKRAEIVKKLLIKLGINSLKITSVGFGEDYPIGIHVNHEENRRIEFTIIDKEKMKFKK